jgi:hypothetical protein
MTNSQTSELPTDSRAESSPMDAETLTALQGSIAKWQAIVDGTGEDLGCENCPLCAKFNRAHLQLDSDDDEYGDYDGPVNCAGCPVAEATGRDFCDGSPYEQYLDLTRPLDVAAQELAFLKSLLPPGVES